MGAAAEGEGPVEEAPGIRAVEGPAGAGEALRFLDTAGSDVDAPLVDEAERSRLEALAEGRPTADHRAVLAVQGGRPVGYVGAVFGGQEVVADLAVPPGPSAAVALGALLGEAERIAAGSGAARLGVWLRRTRPADVQQVVDRGYEVRRRLAVLGRTMEGAPEEADPPEGIAIRAYRPDRDDDQVVAVLSAAYAGTAEAGWDRARFAERRRYDWFDPEDLLLAVDGDETAHGLHWTKRRSRTVGEVYNLAVAPRAQGQRLGAALLVAGLRHLHDRGARDVLLWVDRGNERAVSLYTSQGFRTRWDDVELGRELG